MGPPSSQTWVGPNISDAFFQRPEPKRVRHEQVALAAGPPGWRRRWERQGGGQRPSPPGAQSGSAGRASFRHAAEREAPAAGGPTWVPRGVCPLST